MPCGWRAIEMIPDTFNKMWKQPTLYCWFATAWSQCIPCTLQGSAYRNASEGCL